LSIFVLINFTAFGKNFDFSLNDNFAILTIFTLIVCIAGYFIKLQKFNLVIANIAFVSIFINISAVVALTGFINSPFIGLWFLAVFVAPIYRIYGILWVLLAVGVYLGWDYIKNPHDLSKIIFDALLLLTPLVIGSFIWLVKIDKQDNSNKVLKKLSNELDQIANQSEVIINAIGDGVVAIDKTGKIILINPAAQLITGWSRLDAISLHYKTVLQIIDSQNRPISGSQDPIENVLNNNQQVRNNDLVLITKNGKKILSSILVSPINELGSGVIVVFRDITKEKTEEREQAEFISTASHEMRTPVAAIEGYLGLAMSPQVAQIDDKAREYLNKAKESAQHLGRLFQDLLDVSRADDGRLTNHPRVVNVTKFTQDITASMESKATEKGISLVFKPQPNSTSKHIAPVFFANCDNDHLREVLNNLIENAIKYTPSGEVLVDIIADDELITISVKDTGIGIPTEDMSHLFQKFYRVNNTETNQIGGTGLGLYLCRKLIETIGGRIWAESEYKKGSTFYVEIPRINNDTAKSLMSEQSRQIEAMPSSNLEPTNQVSATVLPQPLTQAPIQPANTGSTPNVGVDVYKQTSSNVQPATNVPRSERLTPEQIAEHVAKLKQMAQQQSQQNAQSPAPAPTTPATMQPVIVKAKRGDLRIPNRN